jgi:hypothetical protein
MCTTRLGRRATEVTWPACCWSTTSCSTGAVGLGRGAAEGPSACQATLFFDPRGRPGPRRRLRRRRPFFARVGVEMLPSNDWIAARTSCCTRSRITVNKLFCRGIASSLPAADTRMSDHHAREIAGACAQRRVSPAGCEALIPQAPPTASWAFVVKGRRAWAHAFDGTWLRGEAIAGDRTGERRACLLPLAASGSGEGEGDAHDRTAVNSADTRAA